MRKALLALAAACGVGMCLCACGKRASDPSSRRADGSPSPRPKSELDAGTDRMAKRTEEAIASVDGYLKEQNPKLREKFRKAAEKMTRDKDKWRERLQAKQKELSPQIDRLREQIGKVDDQTKAKLGAELARLQDQSTTTDQKLAELETVGKEAWQNFKAKLKTEQEQAKKAAASPTPTPKQG